MNNAQFNSLEEYSKDLLQTKEVCKLLHISRQGLLFWTREKGFPRPKMRGYYSQREILKWLEVNNVRD